jgi:hypothetical protein
MLLAAIKLIIQYSSRMEALEHGCTGGNTALQLQERDLREWETRMENIYVQQGSQTTKTAETGPGTVHPYNPALRGKNRLCVEG